MAGMPPTPVIQETICISSLNVIPGHRHLRVLQFITFQMLHSARFSSEPEFMFPPPDDRVIEVKMDRIKLRGMGTV